MLLVSRATREEQTARKKETWEFRGIGGTMTFPAVYWGDLNLLHRRTGNPSR